MKNSKTKNKIFFIRHAETYANTGEKYDHPQYIRLTERGHDQAKKVAKKIKNPGKVIVSKYFRTLETAQHLLNKNKDVDFLVFPDLHEFTYLSNKKFLSLANDNNKIVEEYWELMDPKYNDGDNAESFKDFTDRIHNTILKLKKMKTNGDIYVFTHGNFTRGFMILTKEFSNLHKDVKNKNKNLKKMMKRFGECYVTKEYLVDNCEIVEVTDLIRKY